MGREFVHDAIRIVLILVVIYAVLLVFHKLGGGGSVQVGASVQGPLGSGIGNEFSGSL
jgi:hypothetical protein